MTLHARWLPLSLDPVIAEAKRRSRQRRLLLGALIVALAALGVGTTLALRGPAGPNPGRAGAGQGHDSAVANIGGLSITYPAAWKRVSWNCWNAIGSYLLLTTARPTPRCGSTLPPREQLGRNGVAVWFGTAAPLRTIAIVWKVNPPPIGLWAGTKRVTCARGAPRRIGLHLQHRSYAVSGGAVLCGPHQGHSEDVLQRVLGSSFFTR